MCVSSPEQVRLVVENHAVQLNNCNITGLKEERTPETEFFFGSYHVAGEQAVDETMSGFIGPRSEGGLCGIQFSALHSFIVGNTMSVKWMANATFLAEPYYGSDAYVTCGDKMLTIVSSFDSSELKFRE